MVREKEQGFLTHLDAVTPSNRCWRSRRAYRGKLPIAVASGGYRDTITRTLDRLGIRDWFDAMVTAEDTPRHKPEPDVFLEAARRLGVDADGVRGVRGHRHRAGSRPPGGDDGRGCAGVDECEITEYWSRRWSASSASTQHPIPILGSHRCRGSGRPIPGHSDDNGRFSAR